MAAPNLQAQQALLQQVYQDASKIHRKTSSVDRNYGVACEVYLPSG
ncbi:hypothetical protein [Nostoc sp. DSM 114159]